MGYGAMHGIPMVATSPVRHESPVGMNPVEIHSFEPPWKALSDFALHTDLDRLNPNAPHFQHLVNQVHIFEKSFSMLTQLPRVVKYYCTHSASYLFGHFFSLTSSLLVCPLCCRCMATLTCHPIPAATWACPRVPPGQGALLTCQATRQAHRPLHRPRATLTKATAAKTAPTWRTSRARVEGATAT